ncbi:helix-turn-helix domain-containing protein [Levilactobacillus cerevisiae]|uniref:MarR family winged helix-turn-helix transcriptional regulator n=2 Tax=Levilactobacillus cerevisiae TaxID=1704076 RepID=UPI000F7AD369
MTHHFTQTCAYFTAARYMRAVEQLADQVYAPTGMKPAYAYIMMALEDTHPQTIMQLSTTLGYERSSISRMVKTLAAQQLVTLTAQGRATSIDLAPASAAFLKTANDCLIKFGQRTDDLLGTTKAPMTDLLTENNLKLREDFK